MTTTVQADLRQIDEAHHIHPFTHHVNMKTSGAHIIEKAEGSFVYDDKGNKILDGLAGLWCVNMGYNRKEINDAIGAQLNKLCYYPSFFNSTTEPTVLLAEKLNSLGLPRLTHVVFSNSGSGANETALKMIRNYWHLKGKPEKKKILSRTFSYHGVTMGATNLTGLSSCRVPFDLDDTNYVHVPGPYHYLANTDLDAEAYGKWCLEQTEAIILKEDPATIGALFAEPIQGAGGVIIPPVNYLKGLRELARKYDILYVSDEVITGFGRLGVWYASDMWDLDPDILCVAKGITSGYIPLGATRVSSEIADTLRNGGYFAHGHTYSGHPVACAAALANIDLMEKENIMAYVCDEIGPYFESKMQALKAHPAVGEVRAFRLIGALELLDKGKKVTDPYVGLGAKTADAVRSRNCIVRGIANLIAISPTLTISKEEMDILFDAVEGGLNELIK